MQRVEVLAVVKLVMRATAARYRGPGIARSHLYDEMVRDWAFYRDAARELGVTICEMLPETEETRRSNESLRESFENIALAVHFLRRSFPSESVELVVKGRTMRQIHMAVKGKLRVTVTEEVEEFCKRLEWLVKIDLENVLLTMQ